MLFDREKSEQIAQDLLGMQFKLGGRGPKEIDCYGVLVHYYKAFGLELPDYSSSADWGENEDTILSEYAKFFVKLDPDEPLAVGDMILFLSEKEVMGHLGVCLGNNRFIHSYDKIGVKIDNFSTNKIWKERVCGHFRVREK